MITEAQADAITGMAKSFAQELSRITAIGFVEWAYFEGWRQRGRSTNWHHPTLGFDYTTEQVYSLYEKHIAEIPADVQLQNHLG